MYFRCIGKDTVEENHNNRPSTCLINEILTEIICTVRIENFIEDFTLNKYDMGVR